MLVCSLPATLGAHDLRITDTRLLLGENGRVRIDLTLDLDALALGGGPEIPARAAVAALEGLTAQALEERVLALRRMLVRRIRLRADDVQVALTVRFPDRGLPPAHDAPPSFLGTRAQLSGTLPAAADTITFTASRAFPPVHLTVLDTRDARAEPLVVAREMLERGATSTPLRLAPGADAGAMPPALATVLAHYLRLGFEHILPRGFDHVLFVLGLFFFAAGWRPLLLQVSAFTLAHTLILALASLGVLRLSPAVVEPLIALSIAWVAIDDLLPARQRQLQWRAVVVFAFGLLHGLGFAGVLTTLGLPRHALLPALLAFNAGVELGQLSVLASAFFLLGVWRKKRWYRRVIARPAAGVIAAAGLGWLIQRLVA